MINALDYVDLLTESFEPAIDYVEYRSDHVNKNLEYAEYVAQSLGNYPRGSSGISGTCGLSGPSGISGTCGYSGPSGISDINSGLTSPTFEKRLPILKDLELIPIKKQPIKIQSSGLYGTFNNSCSYRLYE